MHHGHIGVTSYLNLNFESILHEAGYMKPNSNSVSPNEHYVCMPANKLQWC